MEAMIFIIIVVLSFIGGIAIDYALTNGPKSLNPWNSERRQLRKQKKKLTAIDTYEAPNQQTIDALEAEIFGVGKDIVAFPGYYWEVAHRDDKFHIYLKNEKRQVVDSVRVSKYRLEWGHHYDEYTKKPRTEEQIEAEIQIEMKRMVDAEQARRNDIEMSERIANKYTTKVQDVVPVSIIPARRS